jgi:flagellar FliL protein
MAEEVTKNNSKASIINNNKAVIFIGIFSFLVTTIFFGTFIVITLKQTNAPATKVVLKQAREMGPVISLGNDILVNIRSEEGMEHFLKTNIVLELDSDEKTVAEVTKRVPQIRDLIINVLASKTKEKIIEKEGKDQVRSEIINSINELMTIGKVRNIYFQDFIIQ